MSRLKRAAYWCGLALICLLIHWRGLASWFRADDFAFLALKPTLRDLFAPMAQGTIRLWSDRVYFIAGYGIFGLNALPFHLLAFVIQFANLVLVAWIGARVTGRRSAGFLAAALWAVSDTAVLPLGWASAFNQVLCGFFLLLAFYFLLRYIETGNARYNVYQWIAFLLGFGAMELNVVYPALALAYALLCARKYVRKLWPLVVPSVAYFAIHQAVAPAGKDPAYVLHFTGSMARTFVKYWAWTVGPFESWTPLAMPKWIVPAAVVLISLGLLAFAARRAGAAVFCVAWFAIAIAPVLPLRDHIIEYYSFVPTIGLCWLGGWALAEAWRSRARTVAVGLAAIYLAMMLPRTVASSQFQYRVTRRVESLMDGIARAHELHPSQTILLDGVDTELFYNGVLDHGYRLLGIEHLYLTPESERQIESHPELGDLGEFVLPAGELTKGLEHDELAIYDVRGERLRNITSTYSAQPHEQGLPRRMDVASPLAASFLGPEWYPAEGNHRWMPKRASLRMAGPNAAGQKLYLWGSYPAEQLGAGPVTVTVTANGSVLTPATITAGGDFELAFALPDSLVGAAAIELTVEVSRTFHAGADIRDLGLAFGTFEVR